MGRWKRRTPYVITGIAGRLGFSVISVEKAMMNGEHGFGRRVLQAVEENGLSFRAPAHGHRHHVRGALHDGLAPVRERGQAHYGLTEPDTVTIHDNMGIIATVGRGMIHNPAPPLRVRAQPRACQRAW